MSTTLTYTTNIYTYREINRPLPGVAVGKETNRPCELIYTFGTVLDDNLCVLPIHGTAISLAGEDGSGRKEDIQHVETQICKKYADQ